MIGRTMIFAGSILLLNILGVGYGYWNDDLQIQTAITTGEIEIEFEGYSIEGDLGDGGGLRINFLGEAIDIDGEVPMGYSGSLNYYLRNKGSIPVVINGEKIEPGALSSEQRLIIEANPEGLDNIIVEDYLDIDQWSK